MILCICALYINTYIDNQIIEEGVYALSCLGPSAIFCMIDGL